ncbi:MAG: hypothetical protein EOP09_00210 [Proteobacteria bacterium]|nr:MAG: hypothetical protein EOP09_00210 [Pseudomonadota bacterium]
MTLRSETRKLLGEWLKENRIGRGMHVVPVSLAFESFKKFTAERIPVTRDSFARAMSSTLILRATRYGKRCYLLSKSIGDLS